MKRLFPLTQARALALTQALLLSVLISSYAQADTNADYSELFQHEASSAELTKLTTQLSPSAQAKGDFSQYRYLKVLKKPLVSQGEFIFAKDLGVIWQQNMPFSSTLILKDKQLIQIDSQGNININNAEQAGSGNQISDVMPKLLNALLSGDIQQLEQHFSLSLLLEPNTEGQAPQQWQLGLKPTDPLLEKAMPQMVLAGNEQIQTLVLFSRNGDRSRIEFSAIDESPLTAADKQRFSPASLSDPSVNNAPNIEGK
ncbi:outer membrane lipoprotein carrier protein LolA [Shewanella halifaxensis HAW-EB4]|uniref:Outer membrane lipoprotein carrier protein LolA n=1 Tax=Shewanella halifaxensis (strain HAW-EB4) TaxID=458817 RepID=B0TPS7_SHEHH|nr:outer membrane lipoprotein carrier protein LolA [Shewanella halifaxensis]ABZ74948.1 outer membrane lipoprotein carrier protein LolA [Shewanella halifaxensis HAW-EB4]